MAEISLCVFRQDFKKKKEEVAKGISIPYKHKNKLSPRKWQAHANAQKTADPSLASV